MTTRRRSGHVHGRGRSGEFSELPSRVDDRTAEMEEMVDALEAESSSDDDGEHCRSAMRHGRIAFPVDIPPGDLSSDDDDDEEAPYPAAATLHDPYEAASEKASETPSSEWEKSAIAAGEDTLAGGACAFRVPHDSRVKESHLQPLTAAFLQDSVCGETDDECIEMDDEDYRTFDLAKFGSDSLVYMAFPAADLKMAGFMPSGKKKAAGGDGYDDDSKEDESELSMIKEPDAVHRESSDGHSSDEKSSEEKSDSARRGRTRAVITMPHMPLKQFISEMCLEIGGQNPAYGKGLLLFVHRIAGSPHNLLETIANLLSEAERAHRKPLCNLLNVWMKWFVEDFRNNQYMEDLLYEIEKVIPKVFKGEKCPHIGGSGDVAMYLDRISTLSSISISLSFSSSYSGDAWDPEQQVWKSISRRRMTESIPPNCLCDNDNSLVSRKLKETGLESGSSFTAKERAMRHLFKAKSVRTFDWREFAPLWYPHTFDDSSESRKSLSSAEDLEFIDVGRMAKPEENERKQQEIERRWPHLTLYFVHCFPSKRILSVELNPVDVAQAWTSLVHYIFMQIRWRELTNLGWKGVSEPRVKAMATTSRKTVSGMLMVPVGDGRTSRTASLVDWDETEASSPNVRAMIDVFDMIAHWVQMMLVSELRPEVRAHILKRLLKISAEMIAHGNYDSACAMRAGGLKKHIRDLPMATLADKHKKVEEELDAFDDSRHTIPKRLVEERLKTGEPLIPVMSAYLDKLYRIEAAWKLLNEKGDINMRMVSAMYAVCKELMEAQREDRVYRFTEKRDIQLLLIDELKRYCNVSEEKIEKMAAMAAAIKQPTAEKPKQRTRKSISDYIKEKRSSFSSRGKRMS